MQADARLPGTKGVVCLGMLQVLVWGMSFFLLAVMGEPITRDTGWAAHGVYGSLSLSLMVAAFLAPLSSRLVARHGGRIQLACSGAIVALGLLMVAASHTLVGFMLAWTVIGVGMACGLYETLFSTLGALYAERAGKAPSPALPDFGLCHHAFLAAGCPGDRASWLANACGFERCSTQIGDVVSLYSSHRPTALEYEMTEYMEAAEPAPGVLVSRSIGAIHQSWGAGGSIFFSTPEDGEV